MEQPSQYTTSCKPFYISNWYISTKKDKNDRFVLEKIEILAREMWKIYFNTIELKKYNEIAISSWSTKINESSIQSSTIRISEKTINRLSCNGTSFIWWIQSDCLQIYNLSNLKKAIIEAKSSLQNQIKKQGSKRLIENKFGNFKIWLAFIFRWEHRKWKYWWIP